MSFFIKSKQLNSAIKFSSKTPRKRKSKSKQKNDEIISSEDEENEDNTDLIERASSDEEQETVQEKKLKLAKLYLEEIEKEEKRRLEDKEISKEIISERLKTNHLKQIGRYEIAVADKYKRVDETNIKILKAREQRNTVTCLCISSDDRWLFSGSRDGVVVKWCLEENKKIGVIPFVKANLDRIQGHVGCIYSIALSTDNKFLIVGDSSAAIQIWDPKTLNHIRTLKGHKKQVTGLCVKHNSHTLYSASEDKTIRVWSLDEMAFVETLFGHQDSITSIDVLKSDRLVSAGGRDGSVRLWKVDEESHLVFNSHPENIDCVKLINEQYFVTGGDAGQVCVWGWMKKKPLCSVKAAHGCDPSNLQPYWISAVASFLNSDVIASGSQDGYVRLWKIEDKYRRISKLFEIPVVGVVNALTFSSDGRKLIASVGKDYRLGRWNTVKGAENGVYVIPLDMDT